MTLKMTPIPTFDTCDPDIVFDEDTGERVDLTWVADFDERGVTNATTSPSACPLCGLDSPYVNIGKTHIGYCEPCAVSFIIGANLFGSWEDEIEDEQRGAYAAAGITTLRRIS